MCLVWFFPADQRLDLNKLGPNDNDTVKGQIVGKEHKQTHTFSRILYVTMENVILSGKKSSHVQFCVSLPCISLTL